MAVRVGEWVEILDDERQTSGWERDPVAWCLGRETAERARQLGWQRVRQLEKGLGGRELTEVMRGQHAT